MKEMPDGVMAMLITPMGKDEHIDLPRIVEEMLQSMNWEVKRRDDFPANRVMARMHPASRKYRKRIANCESFIVCSKG